MPTLLVVHHTPSPGMQELLEAVLAGARTDEISGVDVVARPALAATVSDALAADAVLFGTPANIGYMAGALKHFFDQIYYPCLDAMAGIGYGLYVHGNTDTGGAVRSVETITTGLGWRPLAAPIVVVGTPDKAAREACWELGAGVAASLMS